MGKSIIKEKLNKLPLEPGVYIFRDKVGGILYIGKATNLRSRVQSYFRGTETREHIGSMMPSVADVDFQQTDSVLEALILESNLIKKHQPKYNIKEKDDKSFSYFVITKEEYPRVIILRKTDLLKISNDKNAALRNAKLKNSKFIRNSKLEIHHSHVYGPFTSKQQMQIALKIMRKIFPFHSSGQQTEKGCLDFQIGLCSGPYAGAISKEDYRKNVRGIKMILEGKKKKLVTTLEKEMKMAAKKNEFEKAAETRNKIFALQHIRDVALITRNDENFQFPISNFQTNSKFKIQNSKLLRIEAYDISNISGQQAVGSMVVFQNNEPDKSQYRKFKIKTVSGSDDVGMMREVLLRRFKNDWPMPDLALLDGGQGHVNVIGKLVRELGLDVLIVAVAKGKTRKNLNFQFPISNKIPMSQFPKEIKEILGNKNLIKRIMDEAHRFAIGYHRKLRKKDFV